MAEILLVANYRLDKQQSMLRLDDLLEKGLLSNGIDVAVIRPEPFFGLFAQRWFVLNKWLRYVDKFVLFPFRWAVPQDQAKPETIKRHVEIVTRELPMINGGLSGC